MQQQESFSIRLPHAISFAVIVSIFLILQQYAEYLMNDYGFEFSWFAVSIKHLIAFLLWAFLSPLLLKIINKIAVGTNRKLEMIIWLMAIGVAISFFHRVFAIVLYDSIFFIKSSFYRSFFAEVNKIQLLVGWFTSYLQYGVILTILLAVDYYQLYLRKQRDFDRAQLHALKMQLQPHFLFNTLNSISSLIDIDTLRAQRMLSQLGFLLREILEHDQQHFLSLEQELQYSKTYLEIEHTRFEDRMEVTINIEEEMLGVKVPALIMQPLVENAVKHGISKCPEGGEISITCKKVDNTLAMIVANDVQMNGAEKLPGYGIGVRNIRSRLEQIYGTQFSFNQWLEGDRYYSKLVLPLSTNK